jgi:transposase-like protein
MDCQNCHSTDTEVLESRKNSTGRRRRHACKACGFRWTSYDGEPPGRRGGAPKGKPMTQRPPLTAAEVKQILLSQQGHRTLALAMGRSPETVRQVRLGIIRANVHPEIARWQKPAPKPKPGEGPSCYACQHWNERCTMGYPDPLEEGPAFAADCAIYAPDR